MKNSQSTQFRIEYRNADGAIANYIPDFIVKRTDAEIWIVETKGREDLTDLAKWERLQQWCADASAHDDARSFHALSSSKRTGRRTRRGLFAEALSWRSPSYRGASRTSRLRRAKAEPAFAVR